MLRTRMTCTTEFLKKFLKFNHDLYHSQLRLSDWWATQAEEATHGSRKLEW